LTRPIRWDLIAQQCDQMVKYATALRVGTAESESILRRFTRGGPKHPTYQLMPVAVRERQDELGIDAA
jgi:TnpA family transposase